MHWTLAHSSRWLESAVLGAAMVLAASIAWAQPSIYEANQQLELGWQAEEAGEAFEAQGYLNDAFAAYNDAIGFARASMDTAQALGMPKNSRPPSVYYLAGRAELRAALVLKDLRGDWGEINNRLASSQNALAVARDLSDQPQYMNSPRWAGRLTNIHFDWAMAAFIQGNFPEARRNLEACLILMPGHQGAIDGLEAIQYVQGERPSRYTTGGVALPERPSGSGGSSRLGQYVAEIAKVVFGRWGTIAKMVVEDLGRYGRGN